MTVGMTLVELSVGISEENVRGAVRKAMALTPSGRQLCVSFPLPMSWESSQPIEAWVTDEILGSPQVRAESHPWTFSGNISVRVCKLSRQRRIVRAEKGILLFRLEGDMAYRRRVTASQDLVRRAELSTLHPVFTRDVANNVWHLPVRGEVGRIRKRLQALFTWPDEVTLVVGLKNNRRLYWEPLVLDEDLIGVPEKHEYYWANLLPG